MRIFVTENYEAMSAKAADVLAAVVHLKDDCVLGLATGSTPVGLYKELIAKYQAGAISFAKVHTVNLDEYKGLAGTHDQSYRYFMQENLFNHIDVKPENTNVPDGLAADADAECVRYDELVASLGYADIQLLGLGHNGHIGFNEPDTCFTAPTHVVDLTQSTIDANARFFASADDVPRQALTMGVGCIMKAKKVLLVANGEGKADAIYKMVCGPITPDCPASILQLHPDVTVVVDKAAAAKIVEAGVKVC